MKGMGLWRYVRRSEKTHWNAFLSTRSASNPPVAAPRRFDLVKQSAPHRTLDTIVYFRVVEYL